MSSKTFVCLFVFRPIRSWELKKKRKATVGQKPSLGEHLQMFYDEYEIGCFSSNHASIMTSSQSGETGGHDATRTATLTRPSLYIQPEAEGKEFTSPSFIHHFCTAAGL